MKFVSRLSSLLSLLLVAGTSYAQTIGSHDSGGRTPGEVSASTLSGGGVSGDVNVFNGTYAASYTLGSVSTPAGLSYGVTMNYNNNISTGDNPGICLGVPYGQGWNVAVPMITVSTDAFTKYTRDVYCSIAHDPTQTKNFNAGEAKQEGDLYWFAPNISVPGYGSGRLVFKQLIEGGDIAVFVCNEFDQYIEVRDIKETFGAQPR
jgi:hypothetical protein